MATETGAMSVSDAAALSPAEAAHAPALTWSPLKRVAFRFVCCYFLLYILPFPINQIPGINRLTAFWGKLWDAIVMWTGANVLHVTITARPAGSGDTTWNYVQLFCFLVTALLGTAVWTLADRRRLHYRRMHDWLRVLVRYNLAFTMIGYGSFKVIQSQFPAPALDKLLQPYGDASPMGILWTFMGSSYSYNAFTGAGEILGGVLLFFPKLTTLGALVSMGVMSHVVALNFGYDTPVKLFSSHLLLASVFLAAPDAARLVRFFALNRPTAAAELRPLFRRRSLNYSGIALRVILMAYAFQSSLSLSLNSRRSWLQLVNPPLRGIYDVEEFARNGQPVPALLGDSTRWRRMVFARQGALTVRAMNERSRIYRLQTDTVNHTLTLAAFPDTTRKSQLHYERHDGDDLLISGRLDNDSIHVRLKKFDDSSFLLKSRGFHWINEYPFNR
jgi:hypothetical protein